MLYIEKNLIKKGMLLSDDCLTLTSYSETGSVIPFEKCVILLNFRDNGMQVNIANRYGIKNYAVENRDYRFINGDPYDFRYKNIEILNRYHGVRVRNTKRGIRYAAVIHLNGNFTIGIYQSDTDGLPSLAYFME